MNKKNAAMMPIAFGALLIAGTSGSLGSRGAWSFRAPMPSPRQEVATVLLAGKIYVAGGMDQSCCNALDDFTAYDIASDSWTTLANLPLALNHVGLAAMDGKVYLIGGLYSEVGPGPLSISDQVWEYDVAASDWTRRANILHATWAPAVVTYAGKIYVFGGSETLSWSDQSNQVEETQCYDPLQDSWTDDCTPMPVARNHIQAVVVGHHAYISPGRHVSSVFGDANLSRYDFWTDTWTELAPLPNFDRSGGGLAHVGNRLYFIGGEGSGSTGLEKVHAYHIPSDTWVETDSLLSGVHGVWAVAQGDQIFVPGGGSIEGVRPEADNQVYELMHFPPAVRRARY